MTRQLWCSVTLLSLMLIAATGCEMLTKRRLSGTYQRYNKEPMSELMRLSTIQQVRLTDTKFIMTSPVAGEIAMDYTVENGVIYLGGPSGQLTFTIDGLGIISNHGTLGMDGTYMKTE